MFDKAFKLSRLAFLVCLTGCVSYAPVANNEQSYSKAAVTEDFDAFLNFVKRTHPDLSYSADLSELDEMADNVRRSFHDGMTMREAWMEMARVNPSFHDAHVGLRRPVAALEAYEKQGGALFPAQIVFDGNGVMHLGPGVEGVAGAEILSINGVSSDAIVRTLLPRMRGETEALRQLVLARYFSQYFWIAYGGFENYAVRISKNGRARTLILNADANSEAQEDETLFTYEKIDLATGYLNVTTFEIEHKERFEYFLETAFAQIQQDGVTRLIIDLRENGGGARDLSDLLMAYLTDKPYSAISGVKARVTPENVERIPGAKIGDVISLPFKQPVSPPEAYPLRFDGDVYALIGGITYSQAIVFAATLQDFGIAPLAGEKTQGPANQTGQVQKHTLTNTTLEALAPIYIFTRASGDTSRQGVVPEIDIANDPFDPMGSVQLLLDSIAKSTD
ncbi:S41 family peptidase [Hyphococcus sp.]|uniref:S41 family peptidase n=1 Tax=Hyphococcus sp. TaxID=2038636 RepID=UPI0035C6F363